MSRPAHKLEWQRRTRDEFKARRGYSLTSHYGTGGLREQILERDGRKCVRCGMTDEEHRATWRRPITIDHKDRDRRHNIPDNLQTLCLRCHGSKDISPDLTVPRLPEHKGEVMAARARGEPYQQIADALGFSVAAVWKWAKRWEKESQRCHTA